LRIFIWINFTTLISPKRLNFDYIFFAGKG
jgi:hypothetical protein